MHVLHVFNEIKFSGAEIMYANAAPLFQQEGIQMTALSTGETKGDFADQFEKINVRVFHRPLPLGFKNPLSLLRYFRSMQSFIKEEKIDIVHIHRLDVFWYFSLCAFMAGRKSIMTPHNVFKNRKITWIKAWLERMSARKFFRTTFQTIGESVYNNELQYYKNPSVRINNWYDSRRFFPALDNEKKLKRQELGIKEEDFVIISTGSCSSVKNHAAIVEALSIVLTKSPCTYFHLGSGHLEKDEINLAAHLNVQTSTRFLGNKTNVRDYLIASDVYVMPSRFEGLSIAAIEAMACKLPSILYRSPGLTDLIKNDDNGFLINHDSGEIAEKILYLRNNPDVSATMGNSAFKFVTANFYMPDNVTQIIRLYKR